MLIMNIEEPKLQDETDICGDSEEDTLLLRAMASTARHYIASFKWSPPIKSVQLAMGVGGVVAVFLVSFRRHVNETDDALWVVVGDLPSAYLVRDNTENGRDALIGYCELMEDWAFAVLKGESIENVFPVDAEPTVSNAHAVRERVAFIRSEIIENR
jgi:hypothetical protein